jgi:hypothetical protein
MLSLRITDLERSKISYPAIPPTRYPARLDYPAVLSRHN